MPAIRGSSRIFPVGAASSITGPAGNSGATGATGATGPTGDVGPVGVRGTYIVATGASGGPGNSYGNDFITFFLSDGSTIGVSGASGNVGDTQSTNTSYLIVNESELIEHGQLLRLIDGLTAEFNTFTVSGKDITARYDGDTIMFHGATYEFGVLGNTGELAVGVSAAGAVNTHYDGDTLLMRILNHREVFDTANYNANDDITSKPVLTDTTVSASKIHGTSIPFMKKQNFVYDGDPADAPGNTAFHSGLYLGQETDDATIGIYYEFSGITFSGNNPNGNLVGDFGSCCYCSDGNEGAESHDRDCVNYVTKEYCNSINGNFSTFECLKSGCFDTGSCCVNGECVSSTEETCEKYGGFYIDTLSCSEVFDLGGCPASCGFNGACCVNGVCINADQLACDYENGIYFPDTSCESPVPEFEGSQLEGTTYTQFCCDQECRGACCLEEICYDTTAAQCAALIYETTTEDGEVQDGSRGVFWGVGSVCAGPDGPYLWSDDPLERNGWFQATELIDGVDTPCVYASCVCECNRPGDEYNPFGLGGGYGGYIDYIMNETNGCLPPEPPEPPLCTENSNCPEGCCDRDTGLCSLAACSDNCEVNIECAGGECCDVDTGLCGVDACDDDSCGGGQGCPCGQCCVDDVCVDVGCPQCTGDDQCDPENNCCCNTSTGVCEACPPPTGCVAGGCRDGECCVDEQCVPCIDCECNFPLDGSGENDEGYIEYSCDYGCDSNCCYVSHPECENVLNCPGCYDFNDCANSKDPTCEFFLKCSGVCEDCCSCETDSDCVNAESQRGCAGESCIDGVCEKGRDGVLGSCCIWCNDLEQEACNTLNQDPNNQRVNGAVCLDIGDDLPEGVVDGGIYIGSEAQCNQLGGHWNGEGIPCGENDSCPVGSCCQMIGANDRTCGTPPKGRCYNTTKPFCRYIESKAKIAAWDIAICGDENGPNDEFEVDTSCQGGDKCSRVDGTENCVDYPQIQYPGREALMVGFSTFAFKAATCCDLVTLECNFDPAEIGIAGFIEEQQSGLCQPRIPAIQGIGRGAMAGDSGYGNYFPLKINPDWEQLLPMDWHYSYHGCGRANCMVWADIDDNDTERELCERYSGSKINISYWEELCYDGPGRLPYEDWILQEDEHTGRSGMFCGRCFHACNCNTIYTDPDCPFRGFGGETIKCRENYSLNQCYGAGNDDQYCNNEDWSEDYQYYCNEINNPDGYNLWIARSVDGNGIPYDGGCVCCEPSISECTSPGSTDSCDVDPSRCKCGPNGPINPETGVGYPCFRWVRYDPTAGIGDEGYPDEGYPCTDAELEAGTCITSCCPYNNNPAWVGDGFWKDGVSQETNCDRWETQTVEDYIPSGVCEDPYGDGGCCLCQGGECTEFGEQCSPEDCADPNGTCTQTGGGNCHLTCTPETRLNCGAVSTTGLGSSCSSWSQTDPCEDCWYCATGGSSGFTQFRSGQNNARQRGSSENAAPPPPEVPLDGGSGCGTIILADGTCWSCCSQPEYTPVEGCCCNSEGNASVSTFDACEGAGGFYYPTDDITECSDSEFCKGACCTNTLLDAETALCCSYDGDSTSDAQVDGVFACTANPGDDINWVIDIDGIDTTNDCTISNEVQWCYRDSAGNYLSIIETPETCMDTGCPWDDPDVELIWAQSAELCPSVTTDPNVESCCYCGDNPTPREDKYYKYSDCLGFERFECLNDTIDADCIGGVFNRGEQCEDFRCEDPDANRGACCTGEGTNPPFQCFIADSQVDCEGTDENPERRFAGPGTDCCVQTCEGNGTYCCGEDDTSCGDPGFADAPCCDTNGNCEMLPIDDCVEGGGCPGDANQTCEGYDCSGCVCEENQKCPAEDANGNIICKDRCNIFVLDEDGNPTDEVMYPGLAPEFIEQGYICPIKCPNGKYSCPCAKLKPSGTGDACLQYNACRPENYLCPTQLPNDGWSCGPVCEHPTPCPTPDGRCVGACPYSGNVGNPDCPPCVTEEGSMYCRPQRDGADGDACVWECDFGNAGECVGCSSCGAGRPCGIMKETLNEGGEPTGGFSCEGVGGCPDCSDTGNAPPPRKWGGERTCTNCIALWDMGTCCDETAGAPPEDFMGGETMSCSCCMDQPYTDCCTWWSDDVDGCVPPMKDLPEDHSVGYCPHCASGCEDTHFCNPEDFCKINTEVSVDEYGTCAYYCNSIGGHFYGDEYTTDCSSCGNWFITGHEADGWCCYRNKEKNKTECRKVSSRYQCECPEHGGGFGGTFHATQSECQVGCLSKNRIGSCCTSNDCIDAVYEHECTVGSWKLNTPCEYRECDVTMRNFGTSCNILGGYYTLNDCESLGGDWNDGVAREIYDEVEGGDTESSSNNTAPLVSHLCSDLSGACEPACCDEGQGGGCENNGDCGDLYCCNGGCLPSCDGESCSDDTDCGDGLSCCGETNPVCLPSCGGGGGGTDCSQDEQCGGGCCVNGSCTEADDDQSCTDGPCRSHEDCVGSLLCCDIDESGEGTCRPGEGSPPVCDESECGASTCSPDPPYTCGRCIDSLCQCEDNDDGTETCRCVDLGACCRCSPLDGAMCEERTQEECLSYANDDGDGASWLGPGTFCDSPYRRDWPPSITFGDMCVNSPERVIGTGCSIGPVGPCPGETNCHCCMCYGQMPCLESNPGGGVEEGETCCFQCTHGGTGTEMPEYCDNPGFFGCVLAGGIVSKGTCAEGGAVCGGGVEQACCGVLDHCIDTDEYCCPDPPGCPVCRPACSGDDPSGCPPGWCCDNGECVESRPKGDGTGCTDCCREDQDWPFCCPCGCATPQMCGQTYEDCAGG